MSHRARAHLVAGRAEDALATLHGVDDAQAHWLRAVASAWRGQVLQVHIALRKAQTLGGPPSSGVLDVARPFADALLDDTAELRAWVPLALSLWAEEEPPSSSLHLAWELAIRAATWLDEAQEDTLALRPGIVLTLGALKWQMARTEEATQLLRGAQDAGMAVGDLTVFRGATLLLSEIALHDDDAELADAIVQHGRRLLIRRDAAEADALLDNYQQLLSSRSSAHADA